MMKIRNVLLGTALFVSASVANAATAFYPTDGNINFVLETGDLGDYTLAIYDEVADFGTPDFLEVTSPELIFWDGVDTLSDVDANSVTIDGDFVLAVSDGGAWIGGDVNFGSTLTVPEANAYAIQFTGAGGFEMVVDVQPVPVPAAVWLFGTGLLGLIGFSRRKRAG